MENFTENAPTEEVVENAPSEVNAPDVNDNDGNRNEAGTGRGEAAGDSSDEVKERNNLNAQRRIRQRESTKARIRELEERLAKYEGRDDDYSKFRKEQLEERIGDMRAVASDDMANDFEEHASRFFGNDTPKFMRDTYRYAQYVNANEPDLLNYAQREYGPVLLAEWYKRMDDPNLRNQWFGMTQFEKGRVLDRFYSQIVTAIGGRGGARGGSPDIPVPSGGRETPNPSPSNDFGVELGRAFNRHRSKA